MNKTMKVWQLPSFGRNNLALAETSVPAPGRQEVLIRVLAVSLNYRDRLVVEGQLLPDHPQMPFVPVSDMVGEVVAMGSDVTRVGLGDRVLGNFWTQWIDTEPPQAMIRHGLSLGGPLPGMLAEYVVLHEDVAVKAPSSLTNEEASTLPVAALTAWSALIETGNLAPGETVLVQGTGGVALAALQIAQAFDARVILTSRSAEKLERVKALGVTDLIDTGIHPDWSDEALKLTGGRGVDHVMETIGGDNLVQSAAALASGGRIAQIGFQKGGDMVLPIVPMMLKRAIIQGITVGHRRGFEAMNRAFDEHRIKPVIDRVYRFADIHAAFDHLDRGPFGKIVVTVSE
jgi:NADPH:quinone reductase-like Zn-dependent oxidoreductase